MKKLMSKSVVALALLGALPAAAGQATYSGSLCAVVGSTSSKPTYYNSGRLLNQNDGTLSVVCPLQRNVVAPYYSEDMSVSITVVDQNAVETLDVCCTATVAEADGTAITSGSACTDGSSAIAKTLSINLASVFANLNGYLSLRCSLPGVYNGNSSVLASFLVTE